MVREVEKLLNAQDAAKILGMHPNTVYKKVQAGEIPCIKYGTTIRFDPEALRNYGQSQGKETE